MTYQNRKKRTAWLYEFYFELQRQSISINSFCLSGREYRNCIHKVYKPLASYGSNLDSLHQQ